MPVQKDLRGLEAYTADGSVGPVQAGVESTGRVVGGSSQPEE